MKKGIGCGGFGILELILVFGGFSVVILGIISLGMQLRNRVNLDDVSTAENYQNLVLATVMDGNSWARTLTGNFVALPTATTNPLTNPLANPPTIAPADSLSAPFPVAAQPFDLYDAAGALLIPSRSQPTRGLTKQGQICLGTTSGCALRYQLRWWIAANAANPLVVISATLQIDTNVVSLNSTLFSFDNTVLDTRKTVNTLSRHLFPSWVSLGMVSANNPNLAYLSLSGVPACPADFTPGNYCGFNGFSGTVGQSCICPATICNNSQELFRCR